ncbi:MAG: DUF2924 domain-containing protein [Hyphomicrobiales bacterium]|nr:DUF2924 domain-containing protein [Hyphomicrobiales bacterium]
MQPVAAAASNGGGRKPVSFNLEAIASLERPNCITAWVRQFGHMPPKHVSVQFMRKVLAYEEQVRLFGGHSSAVRKALKAALKDPKQGRATSRDKIAPVQLRPGTHLVREWNGRTYQVEVLEDGFRLDGKVYRSLSAIARKITGAHWSGPRFFGLG